MKTMMMPNLFSPGFARCAAAKRIEKSSAGAQKLQVPGNMLNPSVVNALHITAQHALFADSDAADVWSRVLVNPPVI
jgi:hypothetical protein